MYTDSAPSSRRLGTVMILEDDGLLSIMLEELVRNLGAEQVQVHHDTGSALQAARESSFDCAILDVVVRGAVSYVVADVLAERNIPFIFCSGIAPSDIDERHRHRPFLAKPYGDAELELCLKRAVAPDLCSAG